MLDHLGVPIVRWLHGHVCALDHYLASWLALWDEEWQ